MQKGITRQPTIRVEHGLRLRVSVGVGAELASGEFLSEFRSVFRGFFVVFVRRAFAFQEDPIAEFGGAAAAVASAPSTKVFSQTAPRLASAATARCGCG
jgi:hypothetical protein